MLDLNTEEARAIVTALSGGAVPLEYAYLYNVGRQDQMSVVEKEIVGGTRRLRFINGDYGSGKTQFLAIMRHWCVENNFVPSHVVLSPRGTPLYDLKAVYSRIVKNLFLANNASPIESVLEYVFGIFCEWLKVYLLNDSRPRCVKYLIDPLYCHHCTIEGNIEEIYIKDFRTLDPNLQVAITVYREARWGSSPDFATADLVIRWLEGQSIYRRELNYFGLWENLGTGDILKGLSEVSKLVSLTKKKGIVIMLDEAEGIEKCMPYQRPVAAANLEFLIKGANTIRNLYFLYATTPTFFSEASSYSHDLGTIVSTTPQTNLVPLTLSQTRELLQKIAEIYKVSIGNSIPAAKDMFFKNMVEEYCENYSAGPSVSVRNAITGAIGVFRRLAEKTLAQ